MKKSIFTSCKYILISALTIQSCMLSAAKVEPIEEPLTKREIAKEQKEYTDQDVFELIKSQQVPGDKRSFSIRKGDGKLSFGARAANEYYFYRNAMLLNSKLPDEYGFFKTTADIFMQTHWGKKKFGHKAIEAYFNIRHKSVWGLFGKSTATQKSTTQVGQVITKDHGHSASKPLLWLKDAWIKLSLNATTGYVSENLHFLKVGFFPFQLGRGIALGQGYGTPKNFLGIYNQLNDFSAPGILLTGSLMKKVLEYDLYYAKYDEKGQSSGQTFASTRENHVGSRTSPFRGVAKDDEAWALQLRWTAANSKKYGTIDINPYIFYNEASDKTIEFESDSKSRLGTGGVQVEYVHSRFEIGGECAFNFGYEELYNIDRNLIKLKTDVDGTTKEVYSHVQQADNLDFDLNLISAPAVKATKTAIIANENSSDQTKIYGSGPYYKNNANRFRPGYCNQYRGWMVVGDMSYIIPSVACRISLGAGAASGDQNPHKEEVNKNYKGFVGLHELYTGKRIRSIFFLDTRSIKRPLTLVDSINDAAVEDTTFTDLWYLGIGGTFSPKFKDHKCVFNTNSMFFFKQYPSKKYNRETGTISESNASPYLGYELNIITEYTIFTDLKVSMKLAAFMPGSYYSDIKGTPLRGDIFARLEKADQQKLDSDNYRISNHTAYFVNFRLDYRF